MMRLRFCVHNCWFDLNGFDIVRRQVSTRPCQFAMVNARGNPAALIDNALKHRDAQLSFFKSILVVFRSLSDPPGAMDLE